MWVLARFVAFVVVLTLATVSTTRGSVLNDLVALRNSALHYAAGSAPNDPNVVTIRHGLYAQSPFSSAGEIDLAASGFSLAALPSAVEAGIITHPQGRAIALDAATRIKEMVTKSASAVSAADIAAYGYRGMLFHFYTWNALANEFRGNPGTEVSSIDTTLLMYGLLVSADYFQGNVLGDYMAARNSIDWVQWLDQSTPGHENQFRRAYRPGSGFEGWWDWYTQEVILINLMASMSDPGIDGVTVWRAWTRDAVEYVSPDPSSKTFRCIATYNGDPFTDFYGLAFIDFRTLGPDLDGRYWFQEGATSYKGHVEFFGKQQDHPFLDNLTFAFFIDSTGPIAEPNSNPAMPEERTDATVYSVAGGLLYYAPSQNLNSLAQSLSLLVNGTPDFFDWHGWPVATVVATTPGHAVSNTSIVGQDISLIGVAIDNYLTGRVQDRVSLDGDFQMAVSEIFPKFPVIFADGFENASTIGWSSTEP